MAWSPYGRNRRATNTAALIQTVSLHTADPGVDGILNEWSGGDPAYARQAPTFAAPVDGVASLSGPINFTGPATTDAAFIGLWEGVNFVGAAARTGGDAASNAAGEYSIATLNVTATGTITA